MTPGELEMPAIGGWAFSGDGERIEAGQQLVNPFAGHGTGDDRVSGFDVGVIKTAEPEPFDVIAGESGIG